MGLSLLDDDRPDRCQELSEPSIPQFVVSCLLMAWLLVAYFPQYARIVSRKSAEGLSTLYVLLGSLSGTCAVANILILPSTEVEMGCCRTNTTFACISGLLGMVQVIFGIACFWVILFMYVYYSEEEAEAEMKGRRESWSGPERTFRRARRAWIVLLIVCGFVFLILIISATIKNRFPWLSEPWANVLGVAVASLAAVQWVPQIITTWYLGHMGSLSLVSLVLSAPYTWIFGINMIIRVGIAGWSAWVVYLLVGTMQVVLIVTGVVYLIKDWGKPVEDKRESRNSIRQASLSLGHHSGHDIGPGGHRPGGLLNLHFRGWSGSGRSIASSNIPPDERRPLLAPHGSSDQQVPRARSTSQQSPAPSSAVRARRESNLLEILVE